VKDLREPVEGQLALEQRAISACQRALTSVASIARCAASKSSVSQ